MVTTQASTPSTAGTSTSPTMRTGGSGLHFNNKFNLPRLGPCEPQPVSAPALVEMGIRNLPEAAIAPTGKILPSPAYQAKAGGPKILPTTMLTMMKYD